MVSRSVRWRTSMACGPASSSCDRVPSRSTMVSGARERNRAAASSRARGSPSSRRQSSATTGALASVSAKPGDAAVARSSSSCVAGADATLVGVGHVGRRHGERGDRPHDLARQPQRRPGGGEHVDARGSGCGSVRPTGRPHRGGARSCRAEAAAGAARPARRARVSSTLRCCRCWTSKAAATDSPRAAGSRTAASSTTATPSSKSSLVAASRRARRVLPTPPGPTSVTSRSRAHGPGQLRQLLVAPDQRTGIVGDRPAVGATRRRWSRREECRVIGQDPCFQLAQRR